MAQEPVQAIGGDNRSSVPDASIAGQRGVCPNCASAEAGEFCPSCGQSQREWIISTRAWVRDAVSDVFDFDGRIVRTLRQLMIRPGRLTQAWIEGRRASFIRPLRLYLLSSAILFGMSALPGLTGVGAEAVEGALVGFIAGWQRNAATDESPPAWVIAAYQDEEAISRIAIRVAENLPRAMFLLLPFSALLLKVFIRRPRRHYVVHLVWTLHVHAALFLVAAFITLFGPLRGSVKYALAYPLATACGLWMLWYVTKAFSSVYSRSLGRSAASVAALGFAYIPVFTLVVIALSMAAV